MLISEATSVAFSIFSTLRIVSYVPQIAGVARDRNGASAISCPTWLMWTDRRECVDRCVRSDQSQRRLACPGQHDLRRVLRRRHRRDRFQACRWPHLPGMPHLVRQLRRLAVNRSKCDQRT
jgi:hypothetical protein